MKFQEKASTVLDELGKVFKKINEKEVDDFAEVIIKAKRVFVVGAGREGISSRSFAMRLMHLGKEVHWVWDDTTPNIERGDLLIANSGSGEVVSVYNVARLGKKTGSFLATVTANPEGNIAKLSDVVVHIPAEVWGPGKDTIHSIQPMGSLFEQSLLIFHDLVVLILMEKMGKTASEMVSRHRNVE